MKSLFKKIVFLSAFSVILNSAATCFPNYLPYKPDIISVSAETLTLENGLEYTENSTAIIITGCDKSATKVEIPAEIDGFPVTSIGDWAFYGCTSLTEVTVPDSVTSIGYEAFSGTPFLNNQTTDVKYAGKWVVDCNENVTKVEIKSDTVGIADYAFENCASLTEVTIPDSITNIGNCAFLGCESLTEVIIPDSVASIGSEAFGYDYFIFDAPDVGDVYTTIKRDSFKIKGVKGSAAETYANDNEFEFIETEKTKPEIAGDLDGDGEITSSDALNILQFVVNEENLTDEQKKLADMNGDGEITSTDALYILQIIVGLR